MKNRTGTLTIIFLLVLMLLSLPVICNSVETWTQISSDIEGKAGGDLSGIFVSLSANETMVACGATDRVKGRGYMKGDKQPPFIKQTYHLQPNCFMLAAWASYAALQPIARVFFASGPDAAVADQVSTNCFKVAS